MMRNQQPDQQPVRVPNVLDFIANQRSQALDALAQSQASEAALRAENDRLKADISAQADEIARLTALLAENDPAPAKPKPK